MCIRARPMERVSIVCVNSGAAQGRRVKSMCAWIHRLEIKTKRMALKLRPHSGWRLRAPKWWTVSRQSGGFLVLLRPR